VNEQPNPSPQSVQDAFDGKEFNSLKGDRRDENFE
jgi:hypothetical protein